MNRRQVLVGASALAASTVVAQALPEQEYCINPWRQAKSGDAMVKISGIQLAGFISLRDHLGDGSWLEVWTTDGRFLTTELASNQSDVHELHTILTRGMERRQRREMTCYTSYKPVGLKLANSSGRKYLWLRGDEIRNPFYVWEQAGT